MTVSSLIAMTLAAGSVVVEGSSTCPAPNQVAARLEESACANRPLRATVEVSGGEVVVALFGEAQELIARQALPASAPCADLAAAAAVFISSASQERAATELPVADLPLPPPPPPPPLPPPRTWALELGAGVSGARLGTAPAAGGVVDVAARFQTGWQVGLSLGLLSEGAVVLGPGRARWLRPTTRLRAGRSWAPGPVRIDAGGEAVLAVLLLRGEGFDQDLRQVALTPGLGVAVRAALPVGRWSPWLEVSGLGWLRTSTAALRGLDQTADLPRLELMASLGASWSMQ